MSLKINILAVDDKKSNLLLMKSLLQKDELTVICAESGDEALEKIGQEEFALILLDVLMPGKSGFETAELIRRDQKNAHIPIIFVTATDQEEACEFKGYEAGAVDFLYKPVEPLILKSKVNVFAELYRREKKLQRTTVELEKAMGDLKSEITTRKRAQETIKKSERKYKSLFDTSRDGIAIFELDGVLEDANVAYMNMLGYTLEELKSIEIFQFIRGGISDKEKIKIETQLLKQGYSDEFQVDYTGKDGNTFPVLFRSWVINDEDGNPLRRLNLVRDISEQKKVETQLRQAMKMEAVGTLAGGIAHDFNNILAAIMGYIELAQFDISEDNKARYSLDQVLKASHRAKKLVSHILAFSRQSGHEKKPLFMQHIVKETIELLRATLPSTISIKQNIHSKLISVNADPTQVHQILMNLGTNAYHAIGDEGGVIDITMEEYLVDDESDVDLSELDPGRYVRLSVQDNGSGMAPATLSKIFDPYFTTKEVGVGTGMGLSVVHGIIKSHGGAIYAESSPGAGSVFRLYFPVINAVEENNSNAVEMPLRGNERVLFVDDEDMLVGLISRMLEKLGYQVVAETNSLKALELYKANPESFDLIISDLTMPDLTGIQLARNIREISADIPIILCTGYCKQIGKSTLKEIGVDYLLFKPLAVKELALTMRKAIDNITDIQEYRHG